MVESRAFVGNVMQFADIFGVGNVMTVAAMFEALGVGNVMQVADILDACRKSIF
jgi:hypothetical protein